MYLLDRKNVDILLSTTYFESDLDIDAAGFGQRFSCSVCIGLRLVRKLRQLS